MAQFRFRALVTLDGTAPATPGKQHQRDPGKVVVYASHRALPDYCRYFPAVMSRDEARPLGPGDHAVVTITTTDAEAADFFAAGQHFTMWAGNDIGHGIVSRRVFAWSGPC